MYLINLKVILDDYPLKEFSHKNVYKWAHVIKFGFIYDLIFKLKDFL
jgi:hypothetical protein